MKAYVDSTGQYARITTFMKDIGTDEMAKVEKKLHSKIDEIFPKDRYEVTITGKALVFQKGTSYLVDNLIESLIFAILSNCCINAVFIQIVQNGFCIGNY